MVEQQHTRQNIIFGFAVCCAYIAASAVLINFNKFLLEKFPFPWELTALHMTCCSVMSMLLYLVLPGLFPAMHRLEGRKLELLKYFLPLGAFFATALYCSNKAYLYCSVAFLQFMKESNVVLVFLLCCSVGLQRMDRVKAVVVVWILAGSWMCVHGEINFTMIGFVIQAISQFAECSKNVMGEYIMSSADFKLDPLTYTLFMAPVSLLFLSMGVAWTWDPAVIAAAQANWHYLLPNALLAYALNLIIAMVLKNCSAMGFILAGMVKDIVIVVVSSHLFGDFIANMQYIGFAVTLAGCGAWSLLKLMPNGTLAWTLRTITCMPAPESKGERLRLVPESGKKRESA
eukprot:CAMPEP_0170589260 /NCGR_PEP_ID=MMETSP0224-20130122/11258_1 /TAXON_ID=285029 /ORGANISM="Togula jolla, Strain CCCM 725" /LENGTH=343 /DNA_ID=CAMNT_0010913011 /DNA_START=58 /DNA_END=1089 /DNA_ORIENTATION=+